MTPRTLLFLHGIGNDDEPRRWLAALDDSFRRQGAETLRERGYTVAAPSYLDLLAAESVQADPAPDYTYRRPGDESKETDAAGAYWLALSTLERHLRSLPRPSPAPIPRSAVDPIAEAAMVLLLGQAHRFRSSAPLRRAVYKRVLAEMPTEGSVTVVAHSLGSVVVADLLYHLPPKLTVDLIITVGSPLSLTSLHRHLQRLKEGFPFTTVGPWLNVVAHTDLVTGLRGVGSYFPEALDIFVDNGPLTQAHDATRYLEQEAVLRALTWTDEQHAGRGSTSTSLELPMPVALPMVLAGAQYALRLEQAMPPGGRRTRFGRARALVADEIAAQFSANDIDHPMLQRLLRDNAALLRGRFSAEEALGILLTAWLASPVLPYEIKVDEKTRATSLATLAIDLGFTSNWATTVEKAMKSAKEAHGRVDLVKVALVIAGVAAVIAVPALVLAAAPAGLAGGAAVVGGLAALGPGGMIGGLAVVGAVGGAGGTVAATALTAGSSAAVQQNVIFLQALAFTRRDLQLSEHDYREWFTLCAMQSQAANERQRLKRFSDEDAQVVKQLDLKLKHIQRASSWMRSLDLGPKELPAANNKE